LISPQFKRPGAHFEVAKIGQALCLIFYDFQGN
jgi:hypothetical protein